MPKDESHNKKLVDYLKSNVKKGYSLDSLKWALINQKHSRMEVEKAYNLAKREIEQEQSILRARAALENVPKVEMPSVEPEPKSFWRRFFG